MGASPMHSRRAAALIESARVVGAAGSMRESPTPRIVRYARLSAMPKKKTRIYLWLFALALLAGGVAIAKLGVPWLNRARNAGGYPMCASNLRQIGQALKMYTDANAGRLQETLEDLLRRHEVLRTSFVTEQGKPRQVINDVPRQALEVIDLSDRAEPEREQAVRDLAARDPSPDSIRPCRSR